MSSFKNAIPRRAHKERAQPQARKKFGLLEKHRLCGAGDSIPQKEQTLQKLEEKAAFRNLDEFYFKMVKTKTVDRVHRLEEEAEEIASNASEHSNLAASADLPSIIRRKTAASYRELEARKRRMRDLEKLYMDMAMKKELQSNSFREDELVIPITKPVYKWRQERKQ